MHLLRLSFRAAFAGTLALASVVALGQSRKTLAEVLSTWKWDAAQSGPLLAIDAASVRAKSEKTDLAEFDRQRVTVGDLTAVVPTDMVVVDDSFRQSGDLTEGLPAEAKVLYLLTTLSPAQWRLAAGKGIGLGDLQGEQQAVLRSILPKRLRWTTYRVEKDGMDLEPVGKGEVPEEKLGAVRLRISRSLALETPLAEKNAFTIHSTDMDHGKPGDLYLEREDWAQEGKNNFGLAPRQTVRNAAKPSQLPYADATYDAMVELPASSTVRETLTLIGRATGQELHADLRVADLKTTFVGKNVRARDLLKALALGVTGTYRRVGPAYVLTSDVMGLGTRKLRFALWWEDMMKRSARLRTEWKGKIGDGIDQVSFDANGLSAPNESMQAHLAVQDQTPNRDRIPSSQLTPALRNYLDLINKHYPHQRIDTSQVRLSSTFRYGFVLPDGRPLRPEIQRLGERAEFEPRVPFQAPELPKAEVPIPLSEKVKAGLMVKAESAAPAKAAVEVAQAHGFRAVWLETSNPGALTAAIEAGTKLSVPVHLVVRPWNARTDDPERNLLGDTGPQLGRRLDEMELWKEVQRYMPNPWVSNDDRISPSDPGLPAAWAASARLAATPGLAGVVVSNAVTPGYRAPQGIAMSRAIDAARSFGYSVTQRLAFLRQYRIDPIDLVPEGLMVGPDLRQPFFLDDRLRGLPSVYDGRDVPHPDLETAGKRWIEFRVKASEAALLSLVGEVAKSTKVAIGVTEEGRSQMPFEEAVVPWAPGEGLPSMKTLATSDNAGSISVIATLPADLTDERARNLPWIFKSDRVIPLVDLRSVPAGSWAATLDRWFKREEK